MEFLFFKFKGKRYESHRLPVEILSDIQAYSAIVENLAVHLHKSQTGSRVPKGFRNSFKLSLNILGKGSTITPVCRDLEDGYSEVAAGQDKFSAARDLFHKAIEDIICGKELPSEIPPELCKHIEKFGAGLASGDEILISKKSDFSNVLTFDPSVRRNMLKNVKKPYSSFCELSGKVDTLSLSKNKFTLVITGTKEEITGTYSEAFKEALRDAHRHNEKYSVKLYGEGNHDAEGILRSLQSVQHALFIKEGELEVIPNPKERISEIESLKKGWFDGAHGEEFKSSNLKVIHDFILDLSSKHKVPGPYIYPTPEGNITLEWSIGSWEISADFDFEVSVLEASCVNVNNQSSEDKTYSLDNNYVAEFAGMFWEILSKAKEEKLSE